jgi:hypothetical protein
MQVRLGYESDVVVAVPTCSLLGLRSVIRFVHEPKESKRYEQSC